MRMCNLAQTCLEGANLTEANLQDAFMEEAFRRVNLTRANLAGVKGFSLDAILDGAIMPNGNN